MPKELKMFPAEYYTPYGARRNFTPEQLRSEYQRLYKLAADRTRRLEKAGFDRRENWSFTASRGMSDEELASEIGDLERYLSGWESSVAKSRQQRKRTIETLQLKFGNMNIDETNYMEYAMQLKAKAMREHPERYRTNGVPARQRRGTTKKRKKA